MRRLLLHLFVLAFLPATLLQAQERPKVDKRDFALLGMLKYEELSNTLSEANSFYKKKIYDEAYKSYLLIYNEIDTLSALNYRLGVCALMTAYPEEAIQYFLKSDVDVAKDYFYLLGAAYQANHEYEEAYRVYNQYNSLLKRRAKKRFSEQYIQLERECRFGAIALKDSLPYFVTNLGESVNSYYDEYSPVILLDSDILYYTSRKPARTVQKPVYRSLMPEKIRFSRFDVDGSTISQRLQGINQKGNVSVAGADHANNQLLFYKGEKRFGSIFSGKVENGMLFRSHKMRGAVNKKTVHESYLAISSMGDAAFVSNKKRYSTGYDIYFSEAATMHRVKGAVPANLFINTPFDEKSVTFSPDGTTVYFSSNGHEGMGGYDIYKAERLPDGSWSAPENLGYPINTAADELYYYPTSDSLVALMASNRAGGFGGLDIYQVVKDTRIPFELWGEIVDAENGKSVAAKVTVVDDVTKQPVTWVLSDSLSGEYLANLEDVGDFWVQVEADGYLNQVETFDMPTVRNDRVRKDFQLKRLATPFTVYGHVRNIADGAPVQAQILLSKLENDSVVARGYTNGTDGSYSITLSDKMNMAFEVSSTNYHGYSDTLMLRDHPTAQFEKDVFLTRSKIIYTLAGVVSDLQTRAPLLSSLSFYEPGSQTPLVTSYSDSITGKYSVDLESEGPFLVEVNAEGYFFNNFPLGFSSDSTLLVRNISLQKMEMGSKIVVENILFHTGKSSLMPQSFPELDKLARLLLDNEKIHIEVSGHTDNQGSASLNKRLSKSRAESVRNYLREKGVDAARMKSEGYGYDRPIESNDTAAGRAANRRVEIEVIE